MAKKTTEILSDYLSTATIAKRLDISTDTIRREIKAGKLHAELFNGSYFIRAKDFEEWKARNFKPVVAS